MSEFAQQELGALVFQLGRDRSITAGIGDGDVEVLAEQVGLADLLN